MTAGRRACAHCRGPIPVGTYTTALYCGGACRVAAHRAEKVKRAAAGGIPVELRQAQQWVRWRLVRRGERTTKVPLGLNGRAASVADPARWTSWAEASRSRVGDGRGFVLAGDGLVVLDLDHCLDEHGDPSPAAAELLAALPRTWTEISPSGDGLHVWLRGTLGPGRRWQTPSGVDVEAYDRGRFITVTGRVLVDASIAEVRWPRIAGVLGLPELAAAA